MVEIYKARGEPYTVAVEATGKRYGNVFIAEIAGRRDGGLSAEFALVGAPGDVLVMPNNPIAAAEGQILRQPFTVLFAEGTLRDGRREVYVRISIRAASSSIGNPDREVQEKRLVLIGPL